MKVTPMKSHPPGPVGVGAASLLAKAKARHARQTGCCRTCGSTSSYEIEHRAGTGTFWYGACDEHAPKAHATASASVSAHTRSALGEIGMALRYLAGL